MRITGSLLAIGLAVSGAPAAATPPSTFVAVPEATVPSATATPTHPIELVVIAPLAAPPTVTGILDAPTLETLTTPGGLLAMQLGQLGGRDVTLALDPMIVASIRSLGSSAPDAATAWLSRLANAPNDSFALQWADANPVLSLQATGSVLTAPWIPLDPALFAPEGADTVDVDSDDSGMPSLPSQDDLVAWDHSLASIAWPADHTMVESDLDGLQQHGFGGVIVNSVNIPQARIRSPHVAFGAIDGIVSNDTVSGLLRAAIAAPTDDAWALAFEGLSNALAQLSESGDRVIAATLGRVDPSSPLRLSQTLDALTAADGVDLAPLATVLEQPAVSSDFTETEAGADKDRANTIASLHRAEAAVIAFSDVIDEPAALLSSRRAKLLALLSAGWGSVDPLWQTGAEEYLTDCAGILGAVTIQDSSTINLLAENGPFPVTVRNDLAHAVTVYVTVRPDRAILRVMDFRVELSIAANSQAKALVPVQVVANGHLATTVSLSSANRTPVSAPTRVELNVQAGWEGPVTIIMVSLVSLMLLAGIWRTVRSRRRSARAKLRPSPASEAVSTSIAHDPGEPRAPRGGGSA